MNQLEALLDKLGERFGVLAESNTYQLTVVAKNLDVAVGDLFLLPSKRGIHDRIYVFRASQYANIFNRMIDLSDTARNKLTMENSYLSEDLVEEQLIELKGMVLGYGEVGEVGWTFHKPRRLPEHLSDVYRVEPENDNVAEVMGELLLSQLGQEGLYVGDLLAGEQSLPGVKVFLPPYALSHHLGVFGRTGAGKSNLMMVLLRSVMQHNQHCWRSRSSGQPVQRRTSLLAIDPHDEFRLWHAASGGADGIHGIVQGYSTQEQIDLVEPFYYLTLRNLAEENLERRVFLSRADVVPEDLTSISEFSEQQVAFANQQFAQWGEGWIGRLLMGDTQAPGGMDGGPEFLPGTVAAVQRRLGFLRRGNTRLFSPFDPELGDEYHSLLPDIVCALEQGRILIVDTTLMGELEQFLLTTVVARTLFTLRKALRSVEDAAALPDELRQTFGNDDSQGQVGLRTLADELVIRLRKGQLPYLDGVRLRTTDELPYVNVVVEEAPSVLNPQRMKFGSVFRDISRQGRKFGIGLTVVSQQVSEIDKGILTQINTELVMSLGNEDERRKAVSNASADLSGFERELQVMGKGQVIVAASYRDIPLPVQVPEFDQL